MVGSFYCTRARVSRAAGLQYQPCLRSDIGAGLPVLVIRVLAPFMPLALCFAQTAAVNGIVTDASDAVIVRRAALGDPKPGNRPAPGGADQRGGRVLIQHCCPSDVTGSPLRTPGSARSDRPELKLDVDQVRAHRLQAEAGIGKRIGSGSRRPPLCSIPKPPRWAR